MARPNSQEKNALLAPLAQALIDFREKRGLSLNQAAREIGIAPSHLHLLESRSIQPRRPTLAKLVDFFRDLTPEKALGLEASSTAVAPSTRVLFLRAARSFGMSAKRVVVSARSVRVEEGGATVADPAQDPVRLALMRVACQAKGNVLRQLEPETSSFEEPDGTMHAFEWLPGHLLTYECHGRRPVAWTCLFPAEVLELRRAAGVADRTICVRSQSGGPDIGDALHPRRRQGGKRALLVDYPVVGVNYEMADGPGAWTEPLGHTIRRYRKTKQLTLAELAAVVGNSINACSAIEIGSQQPHLSTMRGLLEALPELPPRRMLPGRIAGDEPDVPSEFDQAVAISGLVCDEVVSEIEIQPDGARSLKITHRGLRAVRGDLAQREVIMPRLLGEASVDGAGPPVGARSDLESPRVGLRSTHELKDGQLELRWAKRRGVMGVDLVRTFAPAQRYSMTESQAVATFGLPAPFSEGATHSAVMPAGSVAVRVRMPPDLRYREARSFLWPGAVFPDASLPQWIDRPTPPLSVTTLDGGGVELTATAKDLPPGMKLGIGWELTD